MKTAVCTKYGPPDVVQIQDIKKPKPENDEILVKNRATAVTSGDARTRAFNVPPAVWLPYRLIAGITKPRHPVFGFTVAGVVESVGADVKKFKKGDRVVCGTGMSLGGHAEYKTFKEDALVTKISDKLSFEDVATIPFGALTSLHFLEKGNIEKGDKVLIHGSTGSLGVPAIQLAKYFGAEVTAVCGPSGEKLVKSLGADHVINYKTQNLKDLENTFDVIYDTLGKGSFSEGLAALKSDGRYLRAVNMTILHILRTIWANLTTRKKVIGGVAKENQASLELACKLMAEGKLKAVIDKTYPFKDIARAYELVDGGHKKGDVIITIGKEVL